MHICQLCHNTTKNLHETLASMLHGSHWDLPPAADQRQAHWQHLQYVCVSVVLP